LLKKAAFLSLLFSSLAVEASANEPSLLLHIFTPSRIEIGDLCSAAKQSLVDCNALRTETSVSTNNYVYVAAAGIDTLGGASFNIAISGELTIESILPCPGVDIVYARGTHPTEGGWAQECIFVQVEGPPILSNGTDGFAGIAVLQVEGDGAIQIVPCFGGSTAVLWDGSESQLLGATRLGRVSINWPTPGFGPCRSAVPNETTTWGALKSTF